MTKPWEIGGFLESRGNSLFIDGIEASALADEYGTPLFVFSENRIAENLSVLKRVQWESGPKIKICYASKANSNISILRSVLAAGADIEVNSGGELFKALRAGFEPSQIIFNGTSKDEREIGEAIEAGIYSIQADSMSELEQIDKIASSKGKRANVSLRFVPEIPTDTLHGLRTALVTSKFGMMPDEGVMAYRRWGSGEGSIRLRGIHIHVGSQNPDAKVYSDAFRAQYMEAKRIFLETGFKPEHFNIGGGFPVDYLRDGSHAEQLASGQNKLFSASIDVRGTLKQAWDEIETQASEDGLGDLLKDVEIVTEPGRSVIADSGICLTTVRHTKARPVSTGGEAKTDTWLLTDAGFNILLSMETYKWYYHVVSADRAGEEHSTGYKIAGPLCDGGDVYFDIEGMGRLPDYRLLPEAVGGGERLAILNCGAYSLAQMSAYNGRAFPAVVLVGSDGSPRLIRRRDSYSDLLLNEVGLDRNED